MFSCIETIGPNTFNEVVKMLQWDFCCEFNLLDVDSNPPYDEEAELEETKSCILSIIQDARHSADFLSGTHKSVSSLSETAIEDKRTTAIENLIGALNIIPKELRIMHEILNSTDNVKELIAEFQANLDAQKATLRTATRRHVWDIMEALTRSAKPNTHPSVPVHFYAHDYQHVKICETEGSRIRYWDNKDEPPTQYYLCACFDCTFEGLKSEEGERPQRFELFMMDNDNKLKVNFRDPNRPGVFGKPQISLRWVKEDQSFRSEQLGTKNQLVGRKLPARENPVKVEGKMSGPSFSSMLPEFESWYATMSTKDNPREEFNKWWLVPLLL
ncbi:hypothetical protein FGRMN_6834 [Fusarium graminum]|nr:hypothetical protein FGRMN_6834 [Fusarium graminum]